jgi:hypothetical protein
MDKMFVGRKDGDEGVKLEIPALVTEHGSERLDFSAGGVIGLAANHVLYE